MDLTRRPVLSQIFSTNEKGRVLSATLQFSTNYSRDDTLDVVNPFKLGENDNIGRGTELTVVPVVRPSASGKQAVSLAPGNEEKAETI